MGVINYIFVLVVLLNYNCEGGDVEYDGKLNIILDHSIDHSLTPVYIHRGDIHIRSLQTGAATIDEIEFTYDQIQSLKSLAKKNGNYRLRATTNTIDGNKNYYTFVKACSLIESRLTNTISVNLDHNGNVIAVTIAVPNICTGAEVDMRSLTKFNTTIEVRHMELGPVPDTATYIQKLEREREAKEHGETKDRSFLGKYWMYIVPVVIFMLLPSATNQESGGGGGGGGGAAAAQR